MITSIPGLHTPVFLQVLILGLATDPCACWAKRARSPEAGF